MFHEPDPSSSHFHDGARKISPRAPHLPKQHSPLFDGDNPRLWRDRCEMYFEVFFVSAGLKTIFAALNFKGAAATWLQTIERRGRISDWEEFCTAVFERLDRDHYQTHLRQLDALCQIGSVTEFLETFEELSHVVLLYNPSYDDTFFVTRFLGVSMRTFAQQLPSTDPIMCKKLVCWHCCKKLSWRTDIESLLSLLPSQASSPFHYLRSQDT